MASRYTSSRAGPNRTYQPPAGSRHAASSMTPPQGLFDASSTEAAAHMAAAAAGPAPEELWQRMDEVDDEVVALSKVCGLLQQKVQTLDDAQTHDCHRAAEMFAQVCSLLGTTGALNEKRKDLEGASRTSELDRHRSETRADQQRFEASVKQLLANFKSEITAVSREGESRHSVLQKHLDQLQERLTDVVAAQRQIREDHTRLTTAVDAAEQRLADTRTAQQHATDATTQKLELWGKALVQRVEQERKARHDLATTLQDVSAETERLGEAVAGCDAMLKTTADRAHDAQAEVRRELSQQVARLDGLVATQQSLAVHTGDRLTETEKRASLVEAHVTRLGSSTEALTHSKGTLEQASTASQTSLTALQEALRKLETDSDKRHRKLVESTRTALAEVAKNTDGTPGVLAAVQQELSSVRETLHAHHAAIEAQRLDGTLDSAFAEVKDWLQDLERRTMSRSEIEESLLNMQTQMTALRHAAHTVDVANQMTQRMEDFSHLSGRQATRTR